MWLTCNSDDNRLYYSKWPFYRFTYEAVLRYVKSINLQLYLCTAYYEQNQYVKYCILSMIPEARVIVYQTMESHPSWCEQLEGSFENSYSLTQQEQTNSMKKMAVLIHLKNRVICHHRSVWFYKKRKLFIWFVCLVGCCSNLIFPVP